MIAWIELKHKLMRQVKLILVLYDVTWVKRPVSSQEMTGRLRVLGVLLFLTQSAVYGQSNSRAVLSTSSLSRVVVSRLTGDVFLANQDTVYLLPGDLSEITSNVSHTAGQTPEGMTLSKQEDKLIVCWASAVQSGGETSNPLSGFQLIQEAQPCLSLSRRVSSSEVFVVDEVVVIFVYDSPMVTCRRYILYINWEMAWFGETRENM